MMQNQANHLRECHRHATIAAGRDPSDPFVYRRVFSHLLAGRTGVLDGNEAIERASAAE